MTGRARRGGEGRGWAAPRPKAGGGGRGEASWAATPPAHSARGGKGRGGMSGWAGRPARLRAQGGGWAKKGRKGRGEKRKDFPFFDIYFLYECFHIFNNQKNAWFGMVQQIKEINSRVYHYRMT
jgi:hypothetical protein